MLHYKDQVQQASKSNKPSSQLDRRTSGFSKAISPMDRNYNLQSNNNVQGVATINPDDLALFMANVTQHGVQNQLHGQIHPQASRVQFKDERGVNHDNGKETTINNTTQYQNNIPGHYKSNNPDQRGNNPDQGGNPGNPDNNVTDPFNNWSLNTKLTLYKRTPLPTSVKWTSAIAFEDFYNSFTAHIGQQLHLQYILAPAFHTIYFQHGHDLYVVLGLANKMNIHSSLKLISLEQFYNDIGFLYYALKQALVSRGSDLIIQQESNTDRR